VLEDVCDPSDPRSIGLEQTDSVAGKYGGGFARGELERCGLRVRMLLTGWWETEAS
jgi:hypothetical protein